MIRSALYFVHIHISTLYTLALPRAIWSQIIFLNESFFLSLIVGTSTKLYFFTPTGFEPLYVFILLVAYNIFDVFFFNYH